MYVATDPILGISINFYNFVFYSQGGLEFERVLVSFYWVPCRVYKVRSLANSYFHFAHHLFSRSEYGNIGYHSTRNQSVPLDSATQLEGADAEAGRHGKSKDISNKKGDQMKPVVPIISIELPD